MQVRSSLSSIFLYNSMTKRHYEIAVAVLITLVAVFGFLWFSGIEDDSMTAALPDSLESLGIK